MEFKGTKGEWKTFSDLNYGIGLCYRNNVRIGVLKEDASKGRHISLIVDLHENCDSRMTSEETSANAKLIAAAPDLLEALIGLIDPLTGLVDDATADVIGKERAYKIEQAIEKALSTNP